MNAYIEEHYAFQTELKKKYKQYCIVAFIMFVVFCMIIFFDCIFAIFVKHSFSRVLTDVILFIVLSIVMFCANIFVFQKLSTQFKFSKIPNLNALVLPIFGIIESIKNWRALGSMLKGSSIPSGSKSITEILSYIESAFELNLFRVLIPRYEQFRADYIFSYESFGKDSRSLLQELKSWFSSTKSSCIDADKFSKMQAMYRSFYMRLDAYHRARVKFEELADNMKDHKNFCILLNTELNALAKMSLNLNLIEEKEQTSTKTTVNQQNLTKHDYMKQLFYFNESVLK